MGSNMRAIRIMGEMKRNQGSFDEARLWMGLYDDDMSKYYFCYEGLEDSLYKNGQYMGVFVLRDDFPLTCPVIQLLTPNGRYQVGTNLCLTKVSTFYANEWNPSISLFAVANAVRAHMTVPYDHMVGGLDTSETITKEFTAASRAWNAANPIFQHVFPNLLPKIEKHVLESKHGVECGVECGDDG